MAHTIHLENLRDGYIQLVDHVKMHGRWANPRGKPTTEIEDATIVVEDLVDTLPIGINRGLNTEIAAIEALQLIGGVSTPELVVGASPAFVEFQEFDGHFHGAYGTRIGDQLDHVLNSLRMDHADRRALVTLWDPSLDTQRGVSDYPCTIALGFRIRDDKLNMSVTMRSNDVWRGTAYDIFQFTQLQLTIANTLVIEPGTYTHTAWSLHLYADDLEATEKLEPGKRKPQLPHGLASPNIARFLLEQFQSIDSDLDLMQDERWYWHRLKSIQNKLDQR